MELDQLHDSTLVGLNWLRDYLVLTFVLPNSSVVTIQMLGVRSLRVDELKEGNIVSDAVIFNRDNCNQQTDALREWAEYLVAGGKVLNDSPGAALNHKSVDKTIKLLVNGSAQLFCLTPAYGCTLACLYDGCVVFGPGSD